jgi:uncharacterized protein (TIGR03435 family)
MHSLIRNAGILLVLGSAAFAQTKEAPKTLAFEVASIKPAGPLNPQAIMSGQQRIGMKVDQARVDIGSLSLSDLLRIAFRLKSYQITGPDWLGGERFNIIAKIPDGATEEQVPEMLQTLIAERFKLTYHKDNKEHTVYALVVAKGGHKMKESEPDPSAPASPEPGAPKSPFAEQGPVKVSGDMQGGRGMVVSGGAGTGQTRMNMTPQGTMRMETSKMSMAQLAEALTRFVDKPVVDSTELKGNFQVALELSMDDMRAAARSAGVNIPAGAMPGRGGEGGASPAAGASDPGTSIFSSLQQLGLKLDPRKTPVEILVVDHVEKMPSDN